MGLLPFCLWRRYELLAFWGACELGASCEFSEVGLGAFFLGGLDLRFEAIFSVFRWRMVGFGADLGVLGRDLDLGTEVLDVELERRNLKHPLGASTEIEELLLRSFNGLLGLFFSFVRTFL